MKLNKVTNPLEALHNKQTLLAILNSQVFTVINKTPETTDLLSLQSSLTDGTISSEELEAQVKLDLISLDGDTTVQDYPGIDNLRFYAVELQPADTRAPKPKKAPRPKKPAKMPAGMVDPTTLTLEQLWGDDSALITA